MQTALVKTATDKAIWVEARKQQQPLTSFRNGVQLSTRYFYGALRDTCTTFILECKKASPSEGTIRDDFGPTCITAVYRNYASAISVLTNERCFQGDFDLLPIVSQITPQPTLCKDFIIDPYRIYLVRCYQVGACSLMLSVLGDEQYRQFVAAVYGLEMGVLTEVSNEKGLECAIALGIEVVGINNRDLHDLSIDLNHTRELAPKPEYNVTVVSEPDVSTYTQVCESNHFTNGFLIGSALMAHDDLNAAAYRVLLDENKVCNLTCPQDARTAYGAGVIYGGLVLVTISPRYISIEQAREVVATAPLRYVGVFRNHDATDVVDKTKALSLAAVQLYGNEDQLYIDALCGALSVHVAIQKALSAGGTLPTRDSQHISRYAFGNGRGGSG